MNLEIRNILTFKGSEQYARFTIRDAGGSFATFHRYEIGYPWNVEWHRNLDVEIMFDVLTYAIDFIRSNKMCSHRP